MEMGNTYFGMLIIFSNLIWAQLYYIFLNVSFLLFTHLFRGAYIVLAISPHWPPTSPLSPTPSLLDRTCSVLFSNYVEEKT
jgi:hypothetical protein